MNRKQICPNSFKRIQIEAVVLGVDEHRGAVVPVMSRNPTDRC